MTMYYTQFHTSLCGVILVGDEKGLARLHLVCDEGKRKFEIDPSWEENDDFFAEEKRQILQYIDRKRTGFDLKLNPEGTEYQKKVWKQLEQIPYGEVHSYKQVAEKIGNPKASRAVGMANGKNPIPLIVPCHRVVGANGKLTGFAFGLDMKQKLLRLEEGRG